MLKNVHGFNILRYFMIHFLFMFIIYLSFIDILLNLLGIEIMSDIHPNGEPNFSHSFHFLNYYCIFNLFIIG